MEKFFYSFMNTLPVFICVADAETKVPVYYNKLASESLANMTDTKRVDFIQDAIRLDTLIKYCESTIDTGKGRWFHMETRPCEWMDDRKCILVIGTDYSKSITNEELLTVASYTDSLTGIYNRKIGLEMLSKFINELKIGSPPFTMGFVDIDDLKYVNDKFGHSAGDKYILAVVDLLKQSVRQTDILARMGGDEFLVVFPKCTIDVASSILQEVTNMLDGVNNTNEPRTFYSISYGVLEVGSGDDRDMEALLAEAGALMYKMKGEYKKTRVLP